MIVNNLTELKTAMSGNEFSYWEVFRYAGDNDVFEITDSPVSDFEGSRVVMKKHGNSLVMKKFGTYHDDSADSLVTPYGAVTGATFKRVEAYVFVSFIDALQLIKDGSTVFIKDGDEFCKIGLYTDFSDLYIDDFDDLFEAEFYIKK